MRRRIGPEERDAAEVSVVNGAECGAEGAAVAEVGGEVVDVGLRAVEAANEAMVKVEVGRSEKPVAGGDDDVVEKMDLGGPMVVRFVEEEFVRALFVGGVGFFGSDEVRRPEHGDVEVVFPVLEPFVLVYWTRQVYRLCNLLMLQNHA